MAEIANVNIFIQDVQSDRADLKTILVLSEFDEDDFSKLQTGKYFTSDGTITGSPLRIKYYSSMTEIAIDFLSTSKVYKYANTAFSQKPSPSLIAVGRKDTTDTSFTSALNAIEAVDATPYAIVCTVISNEDVLDIAEWVESRNKVYSTMSSTSAVKQAGSGDIASLLAAQEYNNTMITYHETVDDDGDLEPVDIAILARFLSADPGKSTAKFKTLAGITKGAYTANELVYIKGKNCNVYTTRRSKGIFEEGVVSSGRFLDTQNFGHYFEDTLEGDFFDLQYRESNANRKIDYSDENGIAQLESVLVTAIKKEIDNGTLVKFTKIVGGEEVEVEYDIQKVAKKDESAANRANRIYTGLSFKCQYSNAIHDVDPINGYIYT